MIDLGTILIFLALLIPVGLYIARPLMDRGSVSVSEKEQTLSALMAERGLVRNMAHPLDGSLPTIANPIGFSRTPVWYGSAPPLLGEHTEHVLSDWLDYSASQIEELQASGAI